MEEDKYYLEIKFKNSLISRYSIYEHEAGRIKFKLEDNSKIMCIKTIDGQSFVNKSSIIEIHWWSD
jgi:hypothetical protein